MAGQDFFARIALGNKPIGKDELYESEPIKYEKKLFKPSLSTCGRICEKSYDEMLVEFKEELRELRERFKPFLSNVTPQPEIKRKSMELKEFMFKFESEDDRHNINRVSEGKGEWEDVSIPDYRGPAGKWTGYYRTEFSYEKSEEDKRIWIKFPGVDYITNVYLNNRYIGSHEGFFSPFEFDITDYIKYDTGNILVVEVKNDIPTIGIDDEKLNGDKIYAATGLGWDDPKDGWHHCPPGAGIYNRVIIEEREDIFIHSVFIRPDIDKSSIEIRAQVYNCLNENREVKLYLSICPYNFKDECIENVHIEGIEPAGPGINYYRFMLDIPRFRLWQCDEPWLYTARVGLGTEGEGIADITDATFGMRKFHMDEQFEDKGSLYLNNRPVILRGANDMGHMQQCVLNGDYEQLIDDILIAKLANMNFYRFTQRPVQEEIYHYCDMLGMMNQTDLPLFGYLRRNQFCEALRQAGEMERLIRNHPSAIMVTYINEPCSVVEHKLGHRHLYRDELEAFFDAADRVVKMENPDRVIKRVEGDYDPPTGTGLSDFHCYNMWYTNHAIPIGKLYKGYLPAIKRGWKTGCGEYGIEGLDNYDVMTKYYPGEWLPTSEDMEWIPDRIAQSQTNSMHGDWYEEQYTINDWIRESQHHQAFAAELMTDALRRRSDKVVSTAIHLLIDAWPAGWMKTLIGVDRVPKPSYFTFKKSLEPVRVNLRCDRWRVYTGEILEVEAWLLNDTDNGYTDCRIVATLRDEDREYSSYEIKCNAKLVLPSYAGTIRVKMPEVKGRRRLYLDAVLQDNKGKTLNTERFKIEAFEKLNYSMDSKVAYLGEQAENLLKVLDIPAVDFCNVKNDFNTLFISGVVEYKRYMEKVCEKVSEGAKVVFLQPDKGEKGWEFNDMIFNYRNIINNADAGEVNAKDVQGLFFIARDGENDITKEFMPDDFSYWYNSQTDMIDFTAINYIDSEHITPLLFSYRKPAFSDTQKGGKRKLPVTGVMDYGKGKVVFTSLCLEGRVGLNPVLDYFIGNLVLNLFRY